MHEDEYQGPTPEENEKLRHQKMIDLDRHMRSQTRGSRLTAHNDEESDEEILRRLGVKTHEG